MNPVEFSSLTLPYNSNPVITVHVSKLTDMYPQCNPSAVTSGQCNMDNDSYVVQQAKVETDGHICAIPTSGFSTNVAIHENDNLFCILPLILGEETSTLRFQAEEVIMNPELNIVAVRSGNCVLFYHIELQILIKRAYLPHVIQLITWISSTVVGIVTEYQVFHWELQESVASCTYIFDRFQSLKGFQILKYHTSLDCHWSLLMALSPSKTEGLIQLYSADSKASQIICGHTGIFASLKFAGRSFYSSSVILISAANDTDTRLLCVELDKHEDIPSQKITVPLKQRGVAGSNINLIRQHWFVDIEAVNSFDNHLNSHLSHAFSSDEGMHHCGIVVAAGRRGSIIVVDAINGIVLFQFDLFDPNLCVVSKYVRISPSSNWILRNNPHPQSSYICAGVKLRNATINSVYQATNLPPSSGCLRLLSSRNEIIDIAIDMDALIAQYYVHELQELPQAANIANAYSFHSTVAPAITMLLQFLSDCDIDGVVNLLKMPENSFLRGAAVMKKLCESQNLHQSMYQLQVYVTGLLSPPRDVHRLDAIESLCLATLVRSLVDNASDASLLSWFEGILRNDKLTITEALGDAIRDVMPSWAEHIIAQTNHISVLTSLLATGRYDVQGLVAYLSSQLWDTVLVIDAVLRVMDHDPSNALTISLRIVNEIDQHAQAVNVDSGLTLAAAELWREKLFILAHSVFELFLSFDKLQCASDFMSNAISLFPASCCENRLSLEFRLLEANIVGNRPEFARQLIAAGQTIIDLVDIVKLLEYSGYSDMNIVIENTAVAASIDRHATASCDTALSGFSSLPSDGFAFEANSAAAFDEMFGFHSRFSVDIDSVWSQFDTQSQESLWHNGTGSSTAAIEFQSVGVPPSTDWFESNEAVLAPTKRGVQPAVSSLMPRRRLSLSKSTQLPDAFYCPISLQIMRDPVVCADGHSYERSHISAWLAQSSRSPKTNLPLADRNLIPNHNLKEAIAALANSSMSY